MKVFIGSNETEILISQFCQNCGCILEKDSIGFGWILRDKKRIVKIYDFNDVCEEAGKLNRIHKLEDSLKEERDFRVRRKIISKLAGENVVLAYG